jgi:hypothetical protein
LGVAKQLGEHSKVKLHYKMAYITVSKLFKIHSNVFSQIPTTNVLVVVWSITTQFIDNYALRHWSIGVEEQWDDNERTMEEGKPGAST